MASEEKKESIEGYTFGPVLTKELRKRATTKQGKHVHVTRERKRSSIQFTTYNYFLGGVVWCLDAIRRLYGVDVSAAEREVYKVRRLMAQQYLDTIKERQEQPAEQRHPRHSPRHSLYQRAK